MRGCRALIDCDQFKALACGDEIELILYSNDIIHADPIKLRVALGEVVFTDLIKAVEVARGEVVPVGDSVKHLDDQRDRCEAKLKEVGEVLARIEERLGMARSGVWHYCQQCGKVLTGLERRRRYCPGCLANETGGMDI